MTSKCLARLPIEFTMRVVGHLVVLSIWDDSHTIVIGDLLAEDRVIIAAAKGGRSLVLFLNLL